MQLVKLWRMLPLHARGSEMSFQPLSEVRDALNIQWYRSKMPPARFRELSKRSDRKGWI